jgi:hypothetical protein
MHSHGVEALLLLHGVWHTQDNDEFSKLARAELARVSRRFSWGRGIDAGKFCCT